MGPLGNLAPLDLAYDLRPAENDHVDGCRDEQHQQHRGHLHDGKADAHDRFDKIAVGPKGHHHHGRHGKQQPLPHRATIEEGEAQRGHDTGHLDPPYPELPRRPQRSCLQQEQ